MIGLHSRIPYFFFILFNYIQLLYKIKKYICNKKEKELVS